MKYKQLGDRRGGDTNLQGEPLGVNSEIGRKLKQYYGTLLTPDVPERFSDLLKQLEEVEQQPATEEQE